MQAFFASLCRDYELVQAGPAQPVSERVWRLPASRGDVAVKRYPADQQERAAKESRLLTHLQEGDEPHFRVQQLLRTTAGEALWHGPDGVRALVTGWQAGRCRTYDTYTPEEWTALGASLAALHRRLDRLPLPGLDTLGARLAAFDADAASRRLAGHRDGAGDSPLRTYAATALRLIEQYHPGSIAGFPRDDPQSPIHNDYNQFNYLFDGTLPPVILDWEAAIGAPREYELVRCLNHLPLASPGLARDFVRGYLSVRPLQPARIEWAVDAACLQQAQKQWVIDGWQADPARFDAQLQGAIRMAALMDGARSRLVDFFLRCLEEGR